MLEKLTEEEWNFLLDLQKKYYWFISNHETEDMDSPIEPLTYIDPSGDSLLHMMAHQGDVSAVELLLKAGMDINQLGDMGYTALHYAYNCMDKSKSAEIVKMLLAHGASPDILNEFRLKPGEKHSKDKHDD